MEKYASVWKKDTAFERYNDALLFIKEAFGSPLEILGNVGPGAYLGSMVGRNLGGELAHEIAPKGDKVKSKERARNIALPIAAIASIAGGLLTPGAHKLRGYLLRNSKLTTTDVNNIMDYGYPSLAGLASGTVAGLGTGAAVGGYHRLKNSKSEKPELTHKKHATSNNYDNALLFIKEAGITAKHVETYAPVITGLLAATSAGVLSSKKHKKNEKGLSTMTVDRIAKDAYNKKALELGSKPASSKISEMKTKIKKLQEENPKSDVALTAAISGILAGTSLKKGLSSYKKSVVEGMK